MREKGRINDDSQVSGLSSWVTGGTIYDRENWVMGAGLGPSAYVHALSFGSPGFPGWDPGCRPSTTYQATLRQRPTQQNQKDLQLEYTTRYWGALGRRKKKRLATNVSSGASLKKQNKTKNWVMMEEKNLQMKKHKFTFVHVKTEISRWRCPAGIWM